MAETTEPLVGDISLAGKQFVVDGGFSPKSLINPFAAQIGSGGGAYTDYEQWTFFVQDSWEAGQGFPTPTTQGIYYGEAETRVKGKLFLPAKLEEHGETDGCCSLILYCGKAYSVDGDTVSAWSDEAGEFEELYTVPDTDAVGAATYDGYIWIANGPDSPATWVNIETGETGTLQAGDNEVCAEGFELAYGILYAWCGNMLCYTTSPRSSCRADEIVPTTMEMYEIPPDDPPDQAANPDVWYWYCQQMGSCIEGCEKITGVATTIDGSLNQPYTYITTKCGVYSLLPGDVPLYVRDWPYESEFNGVGSIEHYASIYSPAGETVYKYGPDGIFFDTHASREEPLPCHKRGTFRSLAGVGAQVYGLVTPYDEGGQASVWVNASGGWHFIACLPTGEVGCSLTYDKGSRRLFICTDKGVYSTYIPYVNASPLGRPDAKYQSEGTVELGEFSGNLLEVDKYFHSFYIDGECISPETPVKVWYRTTNPYESCGECRSVSDYDDWDLLGTVTENTQEIHWDCGNGPSTKKVWIRLQLCTTDENRTPVVKAYRIKYLPNVRDRFRWSFSITLPWCNLTKCGVEIEGYNQSEWQCCIENSIRSNQPVDFTDVDGAEYKVWLTDASRVATHDDGADERRIEYRWTVGIMEVCPDPALPCVVKEITSNEKKYEDF